MPVTVTAPVTAPDTRLNVRLPVPLAVEFGFGNVSSGVSVTAIVG